jgi:peptidoglycan/xylan/chitin deacetylase (PgdA/CDA1 family)
MSLAGSGPIVSFTFDDFPQSALHVGGAILKNYGASGTFYAAMGLMDQVNSLGRQFCAEDLQTLLRDGHELGSHTFGHLSSRDSSLRGFEADVWKGKQAVEQVAGADRPHQFSYPYGHVTFRAKPRVGAGMSSCRGICPGVNESPVDLNFLQANSLYSRSWDLKGVHALLERNERCRGWLIFYTHDISDSPSPFGCTPGEFEAVVRLAVERRARVLPIGQVPLNAH